MIATKTILVGGLLTAAAFQTPPILNTITNNHFMSPLPLNSHIQEMKQSGTHTTHHKNGQIKEEVLFDDGNFKIFRTFDEKGNQVFNQDIGSECVEPKQNVKGG